MRTACRLTKCQQPLSMSGIGEGWGDGVEPEIPTPPERTGTRDPTPSPRTEWLTLPSCIRWRAVKNRRRSRSNDSAVILILLGEPFNLKELFEPEENENILSGKQIMMMSQEGFLTNTAFWLDRHWWCHHFMRHPLVMSTLYFLVLKCLHQFSCKACQVRSMSKVHHCTHHENFL